jgi:hypothetical protein
LRKIFRVDMYGNVVADPDHTSDSALCWFDVDHCFPWCRGGRSVQKNFAAVQWDANRRVKSDKLIQTLHKDKMSCGLQLEQFEALMEHVKNQDGRRRDTTADFDKVKYWLTTSPKSGKALSDFQGKFWAWKKSQNRSDGLACGQNLWDFFGHHFDEAAPVAGVAGVACTPAAPAGEDAAADHAHTTVDTHSLNAACEVPSVKISEIEPMPLPEFQLDETGVWRRRTGRVGHVFHVERSTTSRAKCRRCGNIVQKGDIRIGFPMHDRRGDDGAVTGWKHLKCSRVSSSECPVMDDVWVSGWDALSEKERSIVQDELCRKDAPSDSQLDSEEVECGSGGVMAAGVKPVALFPAAQKRNTECDTPPPLPSAGSLPPTRPPNELTCLKVQVRSNLVEVSGRATYSVKDSLRTLGFVWEPSETRKCWSKTFADDTDKNRLLSLVQELATGHSLQYTYEKI